MRELFLDVYFPQDSCVFERQEVEFFTNVQIAKNGFETRLILSDFGRSKFLLEEAIFHKQKIDEIFTFFKIVKGRGFSFRFLDEIDHVGQNEAFACIDGHFFYVRITNSANIFLVKLLKNQGEIQL